MPIFSPHLVVLFHAKYIYIYTKVKYVKIPVNAQHYFNISDL